jgi:hypothetical protein
MKKAIAILFLISGFCYGQQFRQEFIDTDIANFWRAYDKIVVEKDTVKQLQVLQREYIDKATPGLKSLMLVRRYSAKEYWDAIRKYPKFWESIRGNTMSVAKHLPEIDSDIKKLQRLYPALKPVPIYFAIGVFRTGGTAHEGKVLIGAEASLADQKAIIDELPDWRKPFYSGNNPVSGLALLCTHEYIHTQQNELVENLLSKCLYEGVAEFVSCLATGKPSAVPAIAFGKANEKTVVARFVQDMYKMTYDYDWIWGENTNDLKVRDLGYYIGYEICERYYDQATDKSKAVAELISIDYRDEAAVERIVDASKLFPKPIAQLYAAYEAQRPTVIGVSPFESGSTIRPGFTKITVRFSEPLNGQHTSVDLGPLGQDAFPALKGDRIWSADRKSWTIEADLKPNKKYQILISNNFRNADGTRLKPYLIEFETAN